MPRDVARTAAQTEDSPYVEIQIEPDVLDRLRDFGRAHGCADDAEALHLLFQKIDAAQALAAKRGA